MTDDAVESEHGTKDGAFSWRVFAGIVAGVVSLWVIVGWLPLFLDDDWNARGQRGDSFGLVNSLFAGLAFAGVIYAILMQRKDLNVQQTELRRQGEALEAQVEGAARQRFDSVFFQMVRLHGEIVDGVRLPKSGPMAEGRFALRGGYLSLKQAVKDWPAGPVVDDVSGLVTQLGQLRDAYLGWYAEREPELGHYFRNLYRIVKYVDEGDIEDKQTYLGILRAQLSVPELGLLFYNVIGPGFDKFLPLIVRYDFLQNLPPSELSDDRHAELLRRYVAAKDEYESELVLSW